MNPEWEEGSENVFKDLGFPETEAEHLIVYPHENCHSAAAKLPPLSSLFCSPAGSQIRRRPERSTSLLFFS